MKSRMFLIAALSAISCLAADVKSLDAAAEILADATSQIPQAVRQQALCVAVVPAAHGKVSGILARVSTGKTGFASCKENGSWSGPLAIKVKGSESAAWKDDSDLLIVMYTERGAIGFLTSNPKLFQRARFGTNETVQPGPVGAEQPAGKLPDAYVWSRSGNAMTGSKHVPSSVESDGGTSKKLYGREILLPITETAPELPPVTPAVQPFVELLKAFSAGSANTAQATVR